MRIGIHHPAHLNTAVFEHEGNCGSQFCPPGGVGAALGSPDLAASTLTFATQQDTRAHRTHKHTGHTGTQNIQANPHLPSALSTRSRQWSILSRRGNFSSWQWACLVAGTPLAGTWHLLGESQPGMLPATFTIGLSFFSVALTKCPDKISLIKGPAQ